MASSVSSLLGASNATQGTTASTSGSLAAPDKEMFLKLLVSQIKNQNPLNPTDSTQFVSQLAQFSELEQLIAIRGDMENPQGTGTSGAGGTTPAARGQARTVANSGLPGTDPTTPGPGTPGAASSNSNTMQS